MREGDSSTDPALLVQQIEQAQLPLDQIDAQLIVTELDPAPGQLLPDVFLLLQVEHMLRTNTQYKYKTSKRLRQSERNCNDSRQKVKGGPEDMVNTVKLALL